MTAVSPWLQMAHDAARDWFRGHPGAPMPEFERWVVEVWEPEEFLRAGFGWRPGRPVNVVAFTAARRGIREAMGAEQRRRAARNADGIQWSVERSAGQWWDGLEEAS